MRFQIGESFEVGGLEIECLEECPKTDIPSIAPLEFQVWGNKTGAQRM